MIEEKGSGTSAASGGRGAWWNLKVEYEGMKNKEKWEKFIHFLLLTRYSLKPCHILILLSTTNSHRLVQPLSGTWTVSYLNWTMMAPQHRALYKSDCLQSEAKDRGHHYHCLASGLWSAEQAWNTLWLLLPSIKSWLRYSWKWSDAYIYLCVRTVAGYAGRYLWCGQGGEQGGVQGNWNVGHLVLNKQCNKCNGGVDKLPGLGLPPTTDTRRESSSMGETWNKNM